MRRGAAPDTHIADSDSQRSVQGRRYQRTRRCKHGSAACNVFEVHNVVSVARRHDEVHVTIAVDRNTRHATRPSHDSLDAWPYSDSAAAPVHVSRRQCSRGSEVDCNDFGRGRQTCGWCGSVFEPRHRPAPPQGALASRTGSPHVSLKKCTHPDVYVATARSMSPSRSTAKQAPKQTTVSNTRLTMLRSLRLTVTDS